MTISDINIDEPLEQAACERRPGVQPEHEGTILAYVDDPNEVA